MTSRSLAMLLTLCIVVVFAPGVFAGPRWTYFGCQCHNTWTFNDTTTLYPTPANRTGGLAYTVLGECAGQNSDIPLVYPPTSPQQRGYTPPPLQLSRWCYVQVWSCKAALPHFQYDPVTDLWWDYCSCNGNGAGSGAQAGCYFTDQAPVNGWVPTTNVWSKNPA